MGSLNCRIFALEIIAVFYFVSCYCVSGDLDAAGHFSNTNNFVECQSGMLNVILTNPHGGSERPNDIPDRGKGCIGEDGLCKWLNACSNKNESCKANGNRDFNTRELTLAIADHLHDITGHRPFVILSNLHREKLDPNRPIEEATFGDQIAMDAWRAFHGCIEKASEIVTGRSPTGFLLDIHGHRHPQNWSELGYGILTENLNNNLFTAQDSSIRYLASRSHVSFEDILRGNASFGYFLQLQGYEAVPSPRVPSPGTFPYYRGGYITQTHGSRNGGVIDAIQNEVPATVRENDLSNYGSAVSVALINFLKTNNYSLYSTPTSSVGRLVIIASMNISGALLALILHHHKWF